MRASLLLLGLAITGCTCGRGCSPTPAAVPAAPAAPAASLPQPQTPPSEERFANRYLLVAAAKETLEEVQAAAPAGATIVESTQFSGLTPCLFIAVVGVHEKKAEAVAAAKRLKDTFARHSGKWIPNDPERKALCEKKRLDSADAKAPRYVLRGGLMQLSGAPPADADAGLSEDTSGEVHLGDRFDVYDANGLSVKPGCVVTGFTSQFSGTADGEQTCGEQLALAQLDCSIAGDLGQFALRGGAKPPAGWGNPGSHATAQERLLESAEVKAAKAKLEGEATEELPYTEESAAAAWQGAQGTVTFAHWTGKTGNGGRCGDGSTTALSEVLLWPLDGGEPRVLLKLDERDTELIGVSDLGGDGVLELMWSAGSEVWMSTSESSTPLMTESHPFCGCGC